MGSDCPNCGTPMNVEFGTYVCPRCGNLRVAPQQRGDHSRAVSEKKSSKGVSLILVFGGVILFLLCLGILGNENQIDSPSDEKSRAWTAAKMFVRDRLKSPATADFGDQDPDDHVLDMGNNEYGVTGWVDSQNSFGAMIRTRFMTRVRLEGNEWQLLEIEFLE